jgi:hypothetical protein
MLAHKDWLPALSMVGGNSFLVDQRVSSQPPRGILRGPLGWPVLEFIACGAHIGSVNGGATHASYRATPRRQYILLSPLRSTLFGDAIAAF